jgi:YfiH family protein
MKNTDFLIASWQAPANIHGVSTQRTGGFSVGHYDSFNLATHVGDDTEAVARNRARLKQVLQLPSEPIWLNQTHSNSVVRALPTAELMNADASYSNAAKVVCAVLTADCLPVLLCSCDGKQIAAIHAGWRGLLSGIISNTVNALRADNANASLLAWLAPAIGSHCFEVGDEVREAFMQKSPVFESAFTAHKNKWLADIYALARLELQGLGIDKVTGGDYCTMSQTERFYSYRQNPKTGRMATLIWRE